MRKKQIGLNKIRPRPYKMFHPNIVILTMSRIEQVFGFIKTCCQLTVFETVILFYEKRTKHLLPSAPIILKIRKFKQNKVIEKTNLIYFHYLDQSSSGGRGTKTN